MAGHQKQSGCEVLAESHVATVTIAVLLLTTLDTGFRGLWVPLSYLLEYLYTAIAILDIPYFSFTAAHFNLAITIDYLTAALVSLIAANLLSHRIYGVGPFRHLRSYQHLWVRGKNA